MNQTSEYWWQIAVQHCVQRHPECSTAVEVRVVYPEEIGAAVVTALTPALGWSATAQRQAQRTMQQAIETQDREWHGHPVSTEVRIQTYQRIIQTVIENWLAQTAGQETGKSRRKSSAVKEA